MGCSPELLLEANNLSWKNKTKNVCGNRQLHGAHIRNRNAIWGAHNPIHSLEVEFSLNSELPQALWILATTLTLVSLG